jgi:hypothetical protein
MGMPSELSLSHIIVNKVEYEPFKDIISNLVKAKFPLTYIDGNIHMICSHDPVVIGAFKQAQLAVKNEVGILRQWPSITPEEITDFLATYARSYIDEYLGTGKLDATVSRTRAWTVTLLTSIFDYS